MLLLRGSFAQARQEDFQVPKCSHSTKPESSVQKIYACMGWDLLGLAGVTGKSLL